MNNMTDETGPKWETSNNDGELWTFKAGKFSIYIWGREDDDYDWDIRHELHGGMYELIVSGRGDERGRGIDASKPRAVGFLNWELLRRVRELWDDPRAYVEPNGDESWALCVSRGKGRCIVATAAPTETESLLLALEMEAPHVR